MSKRNMFFFYCLGITTGGNIQLLFQSLLGKKGYLNYVETHWIDLPWGFYVSAILLMTIGAWRIFRDIQKCSEGR